MTPSLVRDAAALAALAAAWWDLWRRVPDASPFTTPAWLLAWWTVFTPGDLHTVALWEGGRLVALAPLYRETGPRGRRLLPLGIGLSDDSDVLLDPAVPGAGPALVEALLATAADWDRWSAEELPPGAAALALELPAGWRGASIPQSACPVLDLPAGPDALARAVPAGRRRKWRMAQHRSARRGAVLDTVAPDGVPGVLDDLARLHGARWTQRGEAGVLAEPAVQRFHRLAAPALARAGLLCLLRLRLGGAVAGVYYGLQTGTAACAYLGGFDPAFAFESPGTVLVGAALEAAVAAGAIRFSFLRGQEPYKYAWGATDRWNSRRTVERAS